eukprot:1103396-Pyramimonas_sp.AAC.1
MRQDGVETVVGLLGHVREIDLPVGPADQLVPDSLARNLALGLDSVLPERRRDFVFVARGKAIWMHGLGAGGRGEQRVLHDLRHRQGRVGSPGQ